MMRGLDQQADNIRETNMEENLLQLNEPLERVLSIPRNHTDDNSGTVNKFLLCTLVCGMAREIKDRAAGIGRHLPLLKIVRDVLHSHLEGGPRERGLSADGHLLNEAELRSEIERRLREYLAQSQELRIEERRLD